MDKVKIKRVKRNKKKTTTKEKILAGLGVGGALMGGIGAVAPKSSQTQFVRTQKQNDQSATAKVKQALKNVFGKAKGAVAPKTAFASSGTVKDWDQNGSYQYGDVVYYEGDFWKYIGYEGSDPNDDSNWVKAEGFANAPFTSVELVPSENDKTLITPGVTGEAEGNTVSGGAFDGLVDDGGGQYHDPATGILYVDVDGEPVAQDTAPAGNATGSAGETNISPEQELTGESGFVPPSGFIPSEAGGWYNPVTGQSLDEQGNDTTPPNTQEDTTEESGFVPPAGFVPSESGGWYNPLTNQALDENGNDVSPTQDPSRLGQIGNAITGAAGAVGNAVGDAAGAVGSAIGAAGEAIGGAFADGSNVDSQSLPGYVGPSVSDNSNPGLPVSGIGAVEEGGAGGGGAAAVDTENLAVRFDVNNALTGTVTINGNPVTLSIIQAPDANAGKIFDSNGQEVTQDLINQGIDVSGLRNAFANAPVESQVIPPATVNPTDNAGKELDVTGTRTLNLQTDGLTETTLAVGEYFASQVVADSNKGPLTWTVSGNVPAGLSITGGQTEGPLLGFNGKVATPGDYKFTISVTDADGNSGSIDFNLTVNPATVTPPVIETPPAAGSEAVMNMINVSGGGSTQFKVGEKWQINITNATPSAPVYAEGGLVGTGGGRIQLGTTDGQGNFSLVQANPFASSEVGEWEVNILVGDEQVGSALNFTVNDYFVPTYINNATVTLIGGTEQGFNPMYFATLETAQHVANIVGGRVVELPIDFRMANLTVKTQYCVQLPSGATLNAGTLAHFYEIYPESKFPGMAEQQIKETVATEESRFATYSKHTTTPDGKPVTWKPAGSFGAMSYIGIDSDGNAWVVSPDGLLVPNQAIGFDSSVLGPAGTGISPAAQANVPALSFVNSSGGSATQFKTGESWQINIANAAPNAPVYAEGGINGTGGGRIQLGTTDAQGNFTLTQEHPFASDEAGNWQIKIFVGSQQIGGTLNFTVVGDKSVTVRGSAVGDASTSVIFANLTTGNAKTLEVGDKWQITVTGPEGANVYVTGGINGTSDTNLMGKIQNGSLVLTGTIKENEIGTWEETWKVGNDPATATAIGSFSFTAVKAFTPAYIQGATVTLLGGTPQLFNPMFFPTRDTAQYIADLVGGKVIELDISFGMANLSVTKQYHIQMPSGATLNAGQLADFFTRMPRDKFPGMAEKDIKDIVAAEEERFAQYAAITTTPDGKTITWEPRGSFGHISYIGTDSLGRNWVLGVEGDLQEVKEGVYATTQETVETALQKTSNQESLAQTVDSAAYKAAEANTLLTEKDEIPPASAATPLRTSAAAQSSGSSTDTTRTSGVRSSGSVEGAANSQGSSIPAGYSATGNGTGRSSSTGGGGYVRSLGGADSMASFQGLKMPAGYAASESGMNLQMPAEDLRQYRVGNTYYGYSASTGQIVAFANQQQLQVYFPGGMDANAPALPEGVDVSLANVRPGELISPQITPPTAGLRMPPGYAASSEQVAGSATAQIPGTYTVKKGDTLWNIAKKHYGDGKKWRKVLEANTDKVKNPKTLKVGTVLVIPE